MFTKFKKSVQSFFQKVKAGLKNKVEKFKRFVKSGIDKVEEKVEAVEEALSTRPKFTFLVCMFLSAAVFLLVRRFFPANVVRGYCITCALFVSGMTTLAWRKKIHKKDIEDVCAYAAAN